MNCSYEAIRQLQAYGLNLLFSWKFEDKCGFGDFFLHFVMLSTRDKGNKCFWSDMHTYYVMEYHNDYNDNAIVIRNKFV